MAQEKFYGLNYTCGWIQREAAKASSRFLIFPEIDRNNIPMDRPKALIVPHMKMGASKNTESRNIPSSGVKGIMKLPTMDEKPK